eukprot:6241024-Lingulodinium_polyedra.AAC.1
MGSRSGAVAQEWCHDSSSVSSRPGRSSAGSILAATAAATTQQVRQWRQQQDGAMAHASVRCKPTG